MTTELDRPQSTELTEQQEAELAAAATADLGDDGLTLPRLKLTQKTSKEVEGGKREKGHYINSLTGADYGETCELVIAYSTKGRFLSDRKSGETYSAFGAVCPASWPDQYAGRRFDEIPDAEETYRERVNANEIEWESGPKIQTTRNFVGFVVADPGIPVRLSLKSTSIPAANKIGALLRWSLKAPWHNVIELGAEQRSDSQDNTYYVTTAELGRKADDGERAAAIELHQLIVASLGNLRLVGDEDERAGQRPAAPPGEGDGLDVA